MDKKNLFLETLLLIIDLGLMSKKNFMAAGLHIGCKLYLNSSRPIVLIISDFILKAYAYLSTKYFLPHELIQPYCNDWVCVLISGVPL